MTSGYVFLAFLCDLVDLCGAKKSLIFGFIIKKYNITNDFNCIKSQRFCTTEEKERRAPTAALHRGQKVKRLKEDIILLFSVISLSSVVQNIFSLYLFIIKFCLSQRTELHRQNNNEMEASV
jgi:hypothetical protein